MCKARQQPLLRQSQQVLGYFPLKQQLQLGQLKTPGQPRLRPFPYP